jgi:hypothetical protein
MSRAEDNRRHPRYAIDVEATLKVAGGRRLNARTRDLSRSGICLISGEAITTGSMLNVDLVLAFGDNAYSEPLALEARVVWCSNLGGSFQIGAMFDDLTEQQDGFLDMFLQFLEGHRGGDEDEKKEAKAKDKDDPFA